LCKVGNPACDRYKACDIETFNFDRYGELEKCMNHEKYKKEKGRVKQI